MKKYIKQIATFALIAALASCSSDDDIDYTSVGGNAVPQASISRLDTNFDLPITVYTKEGVTATKIEIYKNAAETTSDPIVLGAKVSDATIGTDGTATFNTSTLGSFDVFPVTSNGTTTLTGKTGTFPLVVVSTYSDGSTTRAIYTLTVAKGIVWKVLNAAGLPKTTSSTSGVSTVKYKNPATVKIYYATVTNPGTVVTSVVGSWSKNSATGPFTQFDNAVLPLSTTTQTIDIANIPYATYGGLVAGDKITYRFVVTGSDGQQDTISTTVTFADQVFDAEKSGTLSNSDETSKFSFASGLNYDSGDSSKSEITFEEDFGFVKSRNDVRVQFVKSALTYETANLFAAETEFNAATDANKVLRVSDLNTNDVVLYKITRNVNLGTVEKPNFKDVTYYGLIKVTDHVAGTTSQKLSFSYKEGVLYQATETTPVSPLVVVTPAP
ncbi:hypothetical protein SD960_04470 [Flavobacterium sp. MMLR14_040]|uniref:hypothetical protein n=1 Tax=Flavobacterium sp. MMLR14_040 TaxID=3093843 RepID=UPI0029903A41|nr:hypothetical protein [Flavobacterium sp. MMLR14_040]MDW8849336.1 hypothetical protein [Flavobacterium sp. MMLR14_040]